MSTALRMIKMNVQGQQEQDGSLTLAFILTGLNDKAEADEFVKLVATKLQNAIPRMIKRRGGTIYHRGIPHE